MSDCKFSEAGPTINQWQPPSIDFVMGGPLPWRNIANKAGKGGVVFLGIGMAQAAPYLAQECAEAFANQPNNCGDLADLPEAIAKTLTFTSSASESLSLEIAARFFEEIARNSTGGNAPNSEFVLGDPNTGSRLDV